MLFAKRWTLHYSHGRLNVKKLYKFLDATDALINFYVKHDTAQAILWAIHIVQFDGHAQTLIKKQGFKDWREPLHRTLETCCGLETSNARDRLYACMHLASDHKEGSIQVDYTKAPLDVLFDAVEYHVRHNKNAELLTGTHATSALTPIGCPTWLPDSWLDPEGESIYEPSNRPKNAPWGQYQPDMSLDTSDLRLKLRGIHVDSVTRCLTWDLDANNFSVDQLWNSHYGRYLGSEETLEKMLDMIFDVLFQEPGIEDRRDSLYRVITLDCLQSMAYKTLGSSPIREGGSFGSIVIDEIRPEDRLSFLGLIGVLMKWDVVELRSGNLALLKKGRYEPETEVWVVLGCHLCIRLRRQSSSVYLHSCPAIFPVWENFEGFKNFTELSLAGEKIGDFVVEDIEIA